TGSLNGSVLLPLATGLNTVTYGGTLGLTDVPTVTGGEVYPLFSALIYNPSSFTSIVPASPSGLSWDTTTLTVDGTLHVSGGTGPSRPRITQAQLSGTALSISGTGGTATTDYYVLTSTDATLPLANWTFATTNQFDGSGNFQFTTPRTP